MADKQGQIVEESKLHRDETHAEASKIDDRGGVGAASLAPRFSARDEQSQKNKHGADQRTESLTGTIRYAPWTFCRKIERIVIENGLHALGGFLDYLGQCLATCKKTVIRGVGMPSRHENRVR